MKFQPIHLLYAFFGIPCLLGLINEPWVLLILCAVVALLWLWWKVVVISFKTALGLIGVGLVAYEIGKRNAQS
jgi:hypothetical protein